MTTHQMIKNFKLTAKQHEEFISEIAPYRDRFHEFLTENPAIALWWDCVVYHEEQPERDEPFVFEVDEFTLDFSRTKDGIYFSADVAPQDVIWLPDVSGCYFTIPFEYIEDPEKWEVTELAAAAKRQDLAESAYGKIAPGLREELNLKVVVYRGRGTNEMSSYVGVNDVPGNIYNHPLQKKVVVSDFVVDCESGEVISKSLV